jgi:hypothetical protein
MNRVDHPGITAVQTLTLNLEAPESDSSVESLLANPDEGRYLLHRMSGIRVHFSRAARNAR